ncbi:MAG: hypothetical protein K9G26_08980 [Emcibacter sp.]|nr:hypothetical protein [Emcibacter sp.]
MKRFYKLATIRPLDNGYVVDLDGREVKTPEKRANVIPTKALAEAIAVEWNAQKDKVNANDMLLAKLNYTAIDRVGERRNDLMDELVKYAGSDLLCYRAEFPEILVERQNRLWQPLLDWVLSTHDMMLRVTNGIIHVEQDAQEIAKLRQFLTPLNSHFLTAFYIMTTLCGSVTIALNLIGGNITVDQAWDAAQLDENFQIEQWGADDEATLRHNNMKAELDSVARFLALLNA